MPFADPVGVEAHEYEWCDDIGDPVEPTVPLLEPNDCLPAEGGSEDENRECGQEINDLAGQSNRKGFRKRQVYTRGSLTRMSVFLFLKDRAPDWLQHPRHSKALHGIHGRYIVPRYRGLTTLKRHHEYNELDLGNVLQRGCWRPVPM